MSPPGAASGPGPRRIRDYFARHRRPFVLGIICLILTQAFALTVPLLLKRATDALVARQSQEVVTNAVILILVAILGAFARTASRVYIFNSGREVEFDIRNDSFAHLSRLAPSFYQRMPVGQVMSRLVNDLTQVRLLLGPGLLNLTNTALVYLVVIPLLIYRDPELTFYALLPLPILVLLGRAFARRIYSDSKEAQDRLGLLSTKVQENLSGIMTVRAYRQEAREEAAFLRLNEDYLAVNLRLARLRGVMFPAMGLAGAIGGLVVLWLGGQRIVAGTMTVGGFVEFNAYLAALTWPTIALGWMISLWQRGVASMERINDLFRAEPTLADGPAVPPPFQGKLELKSLSFRYTEDGPYALDNISAVIHPGETVVIVGRTGSGKSTLLKVLTRLLEVQPNRYLIDDQDVTTLPLAHLRAQLGYAPQEAFLFSRTLQENITFGAPDADLASVQDVLTKANLAGEVATFKDGLDTLVGERGITLSGGQRQRTTLARALLVEPGVLVLDDTLSAVDTETEAAILRALTVTKRKRTVIIATHRLACAASADRILVLDRGKLVEQGTEAELLAKGGLYAAMHRRQRLREALRELEVA